MVPDDWATIIDVGCGDGRILNELSKIEKTTLGIDWSSSSLKQISGKEQRIATDISKPWPLAGKWDGAICAEVLEHLPVEQKNRVLDEIRSHTRKGFIVSVPANEPLEVHTAPCFVCGKQYHLWGHLHSFTEFEQVDEFIGQKAIQHQFVQYLGVSPSIQIYRLRKLVGYYPYSATSICPYCGTPLKAPDGRSLPRKGWHWFLSRIENNTSFLRNRAGWFVCRYGSTS